MQEVVVGTAVITFYMMKLKFSVPKESKRKLADRSPEETGPELHVANPKQGTIFTYSLLVLK